MFAKRLFHKVIEEHPPQENLASRYLNPQIILHYGIPSTASILAFDHIQRLLAIGTLDGRIKVIGGENIEGLLISPKQSPFKNLEFLQNQGFLVSVSNENEIQVWNLEERCISSTLLWESNITAFSLIYGTNYMYIGDEHGLLSVLKYDATKGELLHLPYHLAANSVAEAAGISLHNPHSIVGVLPQPCSHGNRMLIAYENGLIILWDISEDQVVLVRGHKDLQLKDEAAFSGNDGIKELPEDPSSFIQEDKEISSLCWVTSDGLILAVGYVDGDILLWNLSIVSSHRNRQAEKSSHNAVKLQLSSAERRLPVIVLHCCANLSHKDHRGQLFVYGGDEIGSEEVLTMLSLNWSSDIETIKCTDRVDLTLNGSFADMILLPNARPMESGHATSLFVLANPGQLHFYDDACISALKSQQNKRPSVQAMQYPVVIPIVEPCMTVGKLSWIDADGTFARAPLETASASEDKLGDDQATENVKWPLTGGVSNRIFSAEVDGSKRLYMAGYRDGSVRIWDTTNFTMSLMFVISSEMKGVEIAGLSDSVSALDFCSTTLNLAIGNECGLVCLSKLIGGSSESSLHFVTETEHEVHPVHQGTGAQRTAIFSVLNSPVRILQFADSGNRLAVGFECGQVAMLNVSSLSVMFVTGCVSATSSPIVSLAVNTLADSHNLVPESKSVNDPEKWVLFILTRDAHIGLVDGNTGNIISSSTRLKEDSAAISMYIQEGGKSVSEVSVEKNSVSLTHNESQSEPGSHLLEDEHKNAVGDTCMERLMDLNVLLCCEDSLSLYSLKSLIQAKDSSIQKVSLVKACLWTTIFQKDDGECGLILLYCTGVMEIRSLPDLEVVTEISLMSILRWSLRTNVGKIVGSTNFGEISLVNGSEFAIVSLLAHEKDFRIPETLPCLHDKVLAAAADAAVEFSQDQKKKQGITQGILGGIIKGFKGGKENDVDLSEAHKNNIAHLEGIFSGSPEVLRAKTGDQEVVELNIDDIDIDEPIILSSHKSKNDKKGKETEREKLFEGATSDATPKLRTPAEIIAKYRKAGDASEAAAHARDKLVQRQEKLERMSRRTEELQNGAENFASMANELAKAMEKRKWWNL